MMPDKVCGRVRHESVAIERPSTVQRASLRGFGGGTPRHLPTIRELPEKAPMTGRSRTNGECGAMNGRRPDPVERTARESLAPTRTSHVPSRDSTSWALQSIALAAPFETGERIKKQAFIE